MSYTIMRTTGTVAYVAERATSAREAVEAAVRDRTNLSGADFTGADFSGVHFTGVDFTGADFTGAIGIIRMGPIDGWEMFAVRWPDGPRIKAGCRWFTVNEAREWWEKGGGPGNTPEHGPLMLAGLDALVALAREHEWEMGEAQR